MTPRLRPARGVFDGRRLHRGRTVRVAGRGIEIGPGDLDAIDVPGVVTPGFVDIQVNGGGGVLLNSAPSVEGIDRIAAAHRAFGTGAIVPTFITDGREAMAAAAAAILAHRGANILGLHLEGPHIAPGRRGTHRADLIRPFDGQILEIAGRFHAAGRPLIVTLAPEMVPADGIAALAARGARVSLGHSDAESVVADRAFAAGATGVTHLFNAMSPLAGRAPGMVGAAILSDAWVSIILDGVHVDPAAASLAIRARPRRDRMILVSDAMPTVGGPPEFDLQGQVISLSDGRLVNADGNLAGAHTTIAEGVRRAVNTLGLPLEAALRMAITHPAAFLGIDIGVDRAPSGYMRFDPARGEVEWLC